MNYLISRGSVILMAGVLLGCGPQTQEKPPAEPQSPAASTAKPETSDSPAGKTATEEAATTRPVIATKEELKAALQVKNPNFQGEVGVAANEEGIFAVEIHDEAIEDISALAGLPLRGLDLARCHVTDISPLKGAALVELYLEDSGVSDLSVLAGMPLVKLYLSNCPVDDIGPLKDTQLQELNLLGTKVADLSPLQGMGIEMLWLNGCPVSDITPLKTVRLKSVTLADTKVSDISPLKGHPTLERLHIGGTQVTDLSVLQWLNLTRLIFTPNRIKTGIEYARGMTSLTEIGTDFDSRMPPDKFWALYDAGEFD